MAYETDPWLYVPAKYIGELRTNPVRLVVIHTGELKEGAIAAETLAKYGQHPDYESSWHLAIDSDSIIQCVKDSHVAWAAPGCNHDGMQIELACYAGQTAGDWRDPYSIAVVALAADATAQYCLKYRLPPVHLSDEQLGAGASGIIGHVQASRVYKKSDHPDPGPNFPWVRFISMVQAMVRERT